MGDLGDEEGETDKLDELVWGSDNEEEDEVWIKNGKCNIQNSGFGRIKP